MTEFFLLSPPGLPKVKTEPIVAEQCSRWSGVVWHKAVSQCHSCKCHLGRSVTFRATATQGLRLLPFVTSNQAE